MITRLTSDMTMDVSFELCRRRAKWRGVSDRRQKHGECQGCDDAQSPHERCDFPQYRHAHSTSSTASLPSMRHRNLIAINPRTLYFEYGASHWGRSRECFSLCRRTKGRRHNSGHSGRSSAPPTGTSTRMRASLPQASSEKGCNPKSIPPGAAESAVGDFRGSYISIFGCHRSKA